MLDFFEQFDIGNIFQLILLAWALGLGVGIIPKSANPERVLENFKVQL